MAFLDELDLSRYWIYNHTSDKTQNYGKLPLPFKSKNKPKPCDNMVKKFGMPGESHKNFADQIVGDGQFSMFGVLWLIFNYIRIIYI